MSLDLKPSLCGSGMQIMLTDCYAFTLETVMGNTYSNADTTTSTAGRDGIRAYNNHGIIICKDEHGAEVLVPFHAVQEFEGHIITEAEGDPKAVKPYSKCLKTELSAIDCEEEEPTLSCFEMSFDFRPPIIPIDDTPTSYHMLNTIRNTCDFPFEHTTVCHPGLEAAVSRLECEDDVYGLVENIDYYSNVEFTPTEEELERGYKDIEYTIVGTTEDGLVVRDRFTYRCVF